MQSEGFPYSQNGAIPILSSDSPYCNNNTSTPPLPRSVYKSYTLPEPSFVSAPVGTNKGTDKVELLCDTRQTIGKGRLKTIAAKGDNSKLIPQVWPIGIACVVLNLN